MKFLLSLFTLILFAESCNSSKDAIANNTIENKNIVQNSLSGTYTITQVGKNEAVSSKLQITFDEASNKVNGFAGCNSFFGSYSTENDNITFSDIASSKKLCQGDISTLESHFLKALKTVNSFSIENNILSLLENETTLIIATKTIKTKSETIKKSDVVKRNYGTHINYQMSSRGIFENIEISKNEILISKDSSLNIRRQYICEEEDWEALNSLIEAINLETIPKLQAPTDKRLSDAAAHATFRIQIGDVEYVAPSFDHGNPPKEIMALVNKVLSIRENAIKQ